MANPEHLRILEKGVNAWNLWRVENSTVIPHLSGVQLSGANLCGVNFHRAELGESDLSGTKLANAIFSNANVNDARFNNSDLAGAKFSGDGFMGTSFRTAKLAKANFSGARLYATTFTGADLSHANFTAAELFHSNIQNANLSRAILHFASIRYSKMSGANFGEANIGATVFGEVDLSDVKGLTTAKHSRPSTLGVDTLQKSKGQIPDEFLRGCGFPEEFIRNLPSFFNQPFQFYSCFISYGHEDKAFARLLHDRLQGQGIRCWLDEHHLLPGDDLHEGIDQGIRLWDKVLLCASKSSLTSWWVDGEINRTFQKEAQIMKERGKKVLALIPLNLDGLLFSDDYQSGKKSEIKSRVAANFVGWEKDHALFDRELEKVIRALKTNDAGREKPPTGKL